jgi:hypothetical protein
MLKIICKKRFNCLFLCHNILAPCKGKLLELRQEMRLQTAIPGCGNLEEKLEKLEGINFLVQVE